MENSILKSTKKNLNVPEDYDVFDLDILTHINSAFSTLNQLGVGPIEGFMIEDDDATWDDFLGTDPRLMNVKTYVYLKVRTVFDPPTNPSVLTSMEKQLSELEWRINVFREGELTT